MTSHLNRDAITAWQDENDIHPVVDWVLSPLTLDAIQAEAIRAHLRHGANSMVHPDQSHERRLAILTEEVGEVAKELNEAAIRAAAYPALAAADPALAAAAGTLDRDALVKELVQVAAMAASWIEAIEGGA